MLAINVDIAEFTKGMNELQEKQLPFATSKALNAVGIDVQLRERARLREVFTLRRPEWAETAGKKGRARPERRAHRTAIACRAWSGRKGR